MQRARLLIAGLGVLVLLALAGAAPASAFPGAYRILIVHTNELPPERLAKQIRTFPDVATVDIVNAGTEGGTVKPTAVQLEEYDLVVDVNNYSYLDASSYGNALADYVDSGGVVVQYAWDNMEGHGPTGRFASGGYPPFTPGSNWNAPTSLGSFDAASPLMEGVASLTTLDNTKDELAPGATLVASWADGRNAIAYKGRVVSVTAYTGDDYEESWAGDYARLTVNAVRWLGRRSLTVGNANQAGGTVSSSVGGILCGTVCRAAFAPGTAVSLSASPNPGFAFAGFAGDCSGTACVLSLTANKAVTADFYSFGTGQKVKKNKKKGTATISFGVGGPGKLVLSGRGVKKQSKSASKAGRVSLPIVARGKALKKLKNSGKAKVQLQVAYTPPGGAAASFTKKVILKLASG